MKPFSIICTSCHVRLAVRNASAIGKIVACPKCSTKLKIEAPSLESSESEEGLVNEAGDDSPLLGAAFDDIDAALSDVSVNQPPPNDSTHDPNSPASNSWEGMVAPPESDSLDPAWGLSSVEPWRRRALIAAPILVGALLMVVVWGVLSSRSKDDEIAQADPTEKDKIEESDEPTQKLEPNGGETNPTEPPQSPNESETPSTEIPSIEPVPVEPAPGETGSESENPDPVAPTTPDAEIIPDEEKPDLNLDNIFGNQIIDNFEPAPPRGGSVGGLPLPVESLIELRPLPERVPIDIEAQLAYPVKGIDFPRTTLTQFIDFVMRLSPMPITIEPEALHQAGIVPDRPLPSLRLIDTTAGEILTEGVASLGLEVSSSEEGVSISKETWLEGLHSVEYSVASLVENDALQCEDLADLLREMVYPESWEGQGGAASILIEGTSFQIAASNAAHFEIDRLFDLLRTARGMTPELVTLTPRAVRASEMYARSLRLNYFEPTPLLDLARRMEEAGRITIYIDWIALAELGWTTQADSALIADGIPLREALHQMLDPMQLTWRVIDANSIQITTPAALAARPEIEIYKVDKLLDRGSSPDQLIANLERAVGSSSFLEAGGSGIIRFDEPSKTILVLLPQPQQIEVTELLYRWQYEE